MTIKYSKYLLPATTVKQLQKSNCLLLRNFCFYGCTGRTQQSIRTAYVKENLFPSGKWFLIPNSLLENQ